MLAVGIRPDQPEAVPLLEDATASGAAAVMFKLRDQPCRVVPQAEEAGIALLAVPDEMSWSHLTSVLFAALRSWVDPGATIGMASVSPRRPLRPGERHRRDGRGRITIEDPRARVLAYSNIEGQAIDEPGSGRSSAGRSPTRRGSAPCTAACGTPTG